MIKPLHTGFAGWLNATEGCLGPVFADRHRSLTFEGETAVALVAYIHNNRVRAGVVRDPGTGPAPAAQPGCGCSLAVARVP